MSTKFFYPFIILGLFLPKILFAQIEPPCITDEILQQQLQNDPFLQDQIDQQELMIQDFIKTCNFSHDSCSEFVIPVVVHVIYHPSIPASNISDTQIVSQINALNAAFSNTDSTPLPAVNTNIKFCLATVKPDGDTIWDGIPGITRTASSSLTYHEQSEISQLAAIGFPQSDYFNIWVVSSINASGILGYSFLPPTLAPYDGVVIRYDVFGDNSLCNCFNLMSNYDQGKTLVHETGHYIGLQHTFQGGCDTVTIDSTNCLTTGDYICDTPPVKYANYDCTPNNSCLNDVPNLFDQIENYMDYTGDICKTTFTEGQRERMHAILKIFRSNLVDFPNLQNTGVQCIPPGLFADILIDSGATQLCVGDLIKFKPTSSFNTAISFEWTFFGGFPYTANGAGPHTIRYDTVGAWDVMLTVADSNGVTITNFKPNFLFVDSCNPITSTQGNWYFGIKAGLDFSSGKPISVLGELQSLEGCASISDSSGNLLFYTNGIAVFDANHDSMPGGILNGNPNSANGPSATQGVTIVPHPGDTNKYYIFTISDVGPLNYGLSYTIVDMTLRGGLGDIDIIALNVPAPGANPKTTEHLAAIPHCNGSEYWIVVHGAEDPFLDKLLAYKLTSTGLQIPVFSNSFSVPGSTTQLWLGQIDAAPNGRIAAITSFSTNRCHLYDFNKATGKFDEITSFQNFSYGVSFSPNSKVLYLMQKPISLKQYIIQIDLSSIYFNLPPPLKIVGETRIPTLVNSLQLGPNGKIYSTRSGYTADTWLSVINYPDQLNTLTNPNGCGFNFNGVKLQSASWSKSGLPNMIDAKPGIPAADFDFFITGCGTVNFHNTSCGTSFFWDFGDSNSDTVQHPTHIYTNTGTYNVTFIIDGNLSVTKTIIINIPDPPQIAGPAIACAGIFSIYSTNDLGLAYDWVVIGGTPVDISSATSIDIVWTDSIGIVILTATEPNNGCVNYDTLIVTVLPAPFANAGNDVNLCFGDSAIIGPPIIDTTVSYNWYPSVELDNSTIPNPTSTTINTIEYILTLTDTITGCSNTDTILVTVFPLPVADAGPDSSICSGDSVVIGIQTPNDSLVYSWLPTIGLDDPNLAAPTAFPAITTEYILTVTDTITGCSSADSVIVTVTTPIATITSVMDITCFGINDGAATVTASGGTPGYTFLWNDGQTTATATGLTANSYNVTITDADGCTSSVNVTINEPILLTLSTTTTNVLCNGASDGTATVTVSGGTSPYTYSWNTTPVQITDTASGLTANSYNVTITDANGCTAAANVTINEPSSLVATITTTKVLCSGASNSGTATVTVSGGTMPYYFLWNDPFAQTTATAIGLAAGLYTVIITDSNGCSSIKKAKIFNDNLSLSILTSDQVCNNPYPDGTATAVITGGTAPYTYQWDDPDSQTTETAVCLSAGEYIVTVTDTNGCIVTDWVTVISAPPGYDFINPVIDSVVYLQFGSYKILGEMVIEKDGVLHMGWSKFEFSYDVINEIGNDYDRARIVIKPGGKIISNDDTLTGCGGGPWDGIEVWGDDMLPQTESLQGVFNLHNTTIINAEKGIFCGRRPLINNRFRPTSGGIVRATNCNFINNRLAVKMQNYPDFNSVSYFTNCTFEYSSSGTFGCVREPQREFISLFDYHGLWIRGCHFINSTPGDFAITDRGWGIKSIDASYTVFESSIQPTIFENLYYGIEATASNSLNSVSITKCKFLYNNRGILLRGVDYAVITENEFDTGEFGGDANTVSYGFYLENCTGYQIEANIIHASTNIGLWGSYIIGSGTGANELYRNEYSDISFGTFAWGNNSGFEIRCNKFTNISSFDIGISGSIAQDQGFCTDNPTDFDAPKTPAGNQFSYTTSHPEGNIYTNLADSINYNHHTGTAYNTTPLNYTSPDINPIPCPATFDTVVSCPSHLPTDCDITCEQELMNKYEDHVDSLKDIFDGNDKDFLLAMIHQDKPAGMLKNALLAASPYLTDRIIYAAINEKPTPLPPGVLKEVILANSPLTNKVKAALDNRIPALPKGIKKEINTVQTGTSARAELEREVIYFERRRELSVSALIRYYLHNYTITNAIDSVIAILEQEEQLEEIKEREEIIIKEPAEKLQPKRKLADAYLKKGNHTKAQQKVDTLIKVSEFKNFGKLKNVMIDIKSTNKSYFELRNDPVIETKVRIVAADSTKYGYVHARAMLDRVFNERISEYFITIPFPINNNNNSSSAIFKSEITSVGIDQQFDTNYLILYPNPASGKVTIKYKLPENTKFGVLNIYDIIGNKVINYQINNVQGIFNLDVSVLPDGLYFYNIIVNNITIARNKLIIIK